MTKANTLLHAFSSVMPVNHSAAEAACQVAETIGYLSSGDAPIFVGINGAQGSGKSTLARLVAEALFRFHGLSAACFSLDDFYLTKSDRAELGQKIHPLCRTRGVPGTHDIGLLSAVLEGLADAGDGDTTYCPIFDKLADDRMAQSQWASFVGQPNVILLEGWCVGILPADMPAWDGPINALEQMSDPDGLWYQWSLDALTRDYQPIWEQMRVLVSIELPDLETVIESRLAQEQGLAEQASAEKIGNSGMGRAAVTRFVQHYERYTRALWAAMPVRADMLFRRNRDYGFILAEEKP